MVLPFNSSGEVAVVFEAFTNNISGSVFLTLFAALVVIMALAMAARIPIEWTALFVYPALIGFVVVTNDLLPVLGITILYSAVLLAKNFVYK